jgi:hypothetical protein
MDAAALVGHLVPAGSVFAFLAEHRHEVFPVELFEDLFPSSTGRPSLPGEVAASVLVLQTLQTCPTGKPWRRCAATSGGRSPAGCHWIMKGSIPAR